MNNVSNQRGAVLLTTLVMLIVIMLFGIQIASQSGINKTLVTNETQRQLTEQYAQNIANEVMSNVNHFLEPDTALAALANPKLNATKVAGTETWTTQYDGYDVEFTTPECIRAKEVDGYSLSATIVPWTNYWTYSVTVSDPVTGAQTTLDIGTKFNYTTGNCV